MFNLGLDGQIVLVTGGARRGRGISRVLTDLGATVVACARRDADGDERPFAEFVSTGIRDPEAVAALVDGIVARYGRLDAVTVTTPAAAPAKFRACRGGLGNVSQQDSRAQYACTADSFAGRQCHDAEAGARRVHRQCVQRQRAPPRRRAPRPTAQPRPAWTTDPARWRSNGPKVRMNSVVVGPSAPNSPRCITATRTGSRPSERPSRWAEWPSPLTWGAQ